MSVSGLSGLVGRAAEPLAVSEVVEIPKGFYGYVVFRFQNSVPLTPETTYFIEARRRSDLYSHQPAVFWHGDFRLEYPRGMAWDGGTAVPRVDVWFQEGIVVPEPTTGALLLVGLGALGAARWFRRARPERVVSGLTTRGSPTASDCIYRLPKEALAGCGGDLLVTDAGEVRWGWAKSVVLHWDATTATFLRKTIFHPDGFGAGIFEHVCFAPISLPRTLQSVTCRVSATEVSRFPQSVLPAVIDRWAGAA